MEIRSYELDTFYGVRVEYPLITSIVIVAADSPIIGLIPLSTGGAWKPDSWWPSFGRSLLANSQGFISSFQHQQTNAIENWEI